MVLLENRYLFGSQKNCWKISICLMNKNTFLEKMVSVRRTKIPFWKIIICSTSRKNVPWKYCDLFDEKINLLGKVQKKVFLEEKNNCFYGVKKTSI